MDKRYKKRNSHEKMSEKGMELFPPLTVEKTRVKDLSINDSYVYVIVLLMR